MSPGDTLHSPPLGYHSTREDAGVSCGDLDGSQELGRQSRAQCRCQTRTPDAVINSHGEIANGKSPFLKILLDADAAASSAAVQLVSFKEALEKNVKSSTDKHKTKRQKGLLLEKLEDFRRINKSVRQTLKQLQDTEASRMNASQQINVLMKRIMQAESENENLKRDLSETERRVEQLMDLRREEQESIKAAFSITKSAEAARAHLQGQLRSKEAENSRLTVQLRTLERTLTKQKMDIDELKDSISLLSKKAAQDKASLKKAARAQKQRAERFEAATEKFYAQLKEKEAELAKACLERDSRKQQKKTMEDEKDKLLAHTKLLKSQITDLKMRLQKEKDEVTATNQVLLEQVGKLCSENKDLSISNATLRASVALLEQQLADCESALEQEKVLSQEKKHCMEQCQCQVAQLHAEIDDLSRKYANISRETKKTRNEKETEVEKVRQELQRRVEEFKPYPELLRAAEQGLFEWHEKLRRSERKCSEKSESIRQLQVKMESQTKLLRSSAEMKESICEANLQQVETVNSLQKQVDKLQQENLELVQRLAAQEEALSYSNQQLDQRSLECQAIRRQLEAALSDVQQQVNKVKEQTLAKEAALQTKIQKLEEEKNRRNNELRLLRQSKVAAEKQFEVRLKDLQFSLDQSESHKQRIQNYVDLLKNTYRTMFDEGLQTSSFESFRFLK